MFQNPKLTNAGKALLYDNMGGAQIVFTSIKLGSGQLSQPIATMTDLVTTEVTIDAGTAAKDDYIDITGTFYNTELAAGFYWREIGVFAADPTAPDDRSKDILYCYQNAYDTADYIPTASVETIEKHISVPVIVGDVANVVCNLQGSLITASMQDIADHNANANAHADIREALKNCLTLNAEGKIPENQLPDMNYIPTSAKGKAGGVATLGADGKIPLTQLLLDAVLSATSENPVQNKIVQAAITEINNALSGKAASNHSHTAAQVGAAASNHTHTAAQVGAAASNHTHTAAQVGAAASNHTHNVADLGGCRIVTGTYAGNGSVRKGNTVSSLSGGQFINLGATPKCVCVGSYADQNSIYTSLYMSARICAISALGSSAQAGNLNLGSTDGQPIDIVNNGFYVGYTRTDTTAHTNSDKRLYAYFAII